VICGGLLFSQYYFSDKIAMFSMHAKEVTPAQEPKLHQIVDRLCLLANMEKPVSAWPRWTSPTPSRPDAVPITP